MEKIRSFIYIMKTLLIRPTDFKAQGHDNPHVNPRGDTSHAMEEHEAITAALTDPVVAVVHAPLPDMVFVSDSGVKLVGLPVILLSRMKYKARREEQPYHLQIFKKLGFRTIHFPKGVFEGQSELKFFHKGTIAVHGYGFRSTRASTEVMQQVPKRYLSEVPSKTTYSCPDPIGQPPLLPLGHCHAQVQRHLVHCAPPRVHQGRP